MAVMELVSEAVASPGLSRAAEAIWVASQRSAWSSLVLIPAEPALSTAAIADAVAATGAAQRGEQVESLDLRGQPLSGSRSFADVLADTTSPFRCVAAIDCPLESEAARFFASLAGSAVLVVERDRTSLASARRVIELVGAERFVGAVVLNRSRR